jgi:hypothetical protein
MSEVKLWITGDVPLTVDSNLFRPTTFPVHPKSPFVLFDVSPQVGFKLHFTLQKEALVTCSLSCVDISYILGYHHVELNNHVLSYVKL